MSITDDSLVLEVRDLDVGVDTATGASHRITHGVSFELHRGRTLALVGESGCGKSVTALAVLNLLARPLRILSGSIRFIDGKRAIEITDLDPVGDAMRSVRGREIAMIFQDPMTALDPVYPVGEQIAEVLRQQLGLKPAAAAARAVELLRLVGIPDPARRAKDYPFQLSGGMRQRVVIAIAVACSPKVLIADEPTTALDVTVQAQILAQLRELGERLGTTMLLITHDLGVVAETADEVAVMYRGHIVERASVDALFESPAHPYTQGLLASLPPVEGERRPLTPISGQVPPITEAVVGCPFAERCPHVLPVCRTQNPPGVVLSEQHSVACFLYAAMEQSA
jgi:oligopeptide/dipeptide ABC transporter ATP-binding protein